MSLHWLTWIQEFGVPFQVVNLSWFKHAPGFELEYEFKLRYTVDYITEVL
jgi:hypothetical protein